MMGLNSNHKSRPRLFVDIYTLEWSIDYSSLGFLSRWSSSSEVLLTVEESGSSEVIGSSVELLSVVSAEPYC
jgi:hypothetical protein